MSEHLPMGWNELPVTRVAVNKTTKQMIIFGVPEPEDESRNCDSMGSSSVSHVIYRGRYIASERG